MIAAEPFRPRGIAANRSFDTAQPVGIVESRDLLHRPDATLLTRSGPLLMPAYHRRDSLNNLGHSRVLDSNPRSDRFS
jgi:hypothetical protein